MYKVFTTAIHLWLHSGKIYIEKKNPSKLHIKHGSKLYLKHAFVIKKIYLSETRYNSDLINNK